jgi:hypothetical protein
MRSSAKIAWLFMPWLFCCDRVIAERLGDGGPTARLCEGLGPVGKWENVTPPDLHCNTAALVVEPRLGTVYAGTGDSCAYPPSHGVLKSSDCGATWSKVNNGKNGEKLDTGDQWALLIDPASSALYTTAGYGVNSLFKSTNGGLDWDDVTPQEPMQDFVGGLSMDPADPSHIFLGYHDVDCTLGGSMTGCYAESTNAGASWKVHSASAQWRAEHGGNGWSAGVLVVPLHGQTWILPEAGLYRTTDSGASWQPVSTYQAGGGSNRFYGTGAGVYYLVQGGQAGIVRSADDGMTWAAIPDTGDWGKSVIGSGEQLYASTRQGIITSREDDGLTWSRLPDSPVHSDGCYLGYDRNNEVLYASCMGDGLWRMRAK